MKQDDFSLLFVEDTHCVAQYDVVDHTGNIVAAFDILVFGEILGPAPQLTAQLHVSQIARDGKDPRERVYLRDVVMYGLFDG